MSDVDTRSDHTIVLPEPAGLPDVLDVLIVGAGPAGTAAAFRARELGMSALVVDMDDVLSKIRDYPKEKNIIPDYVKGDPTQFPDTGELVRKLRFEPIDPVTMHSSWKALYVEHGVAVRVGIELTGAELVDGVWSARLRDRNRRCDEVLRTRTIVLAVGRGVPRRFNIPGNLDDVALRLTDPAEYVGAPVCIVGGGTSAAEAVIAVSSAKAKADDPTPVYWSYRGDKMPRVNDNLSDVFFEAYVRNGNIRYCPNSDPAAVVTAEDKNEYLAIRVDRKFISDRPNEALHLEFPKHRVIACIGEEFPERFLLSLGLPLAVGGRPKKKRCLVTAALESGQPGVYICGDTLSDYHLVTTDFGADPSDFELVDRPGNIKRALRDGVLAIEAAHRRLQGASSFVIPDPGWQKEAEPPRTRPVIAQDDAGETSGPAGQIVVVMRGGTKGDRFLIERNAVTTIGRAGTDVTFAQDTTVSRRHASVAHGRDGFVLRDDGSSSGTFLRLGTEFRDVAPRSIVRIGTHFLRFVIEGTRAYVENYDRKGRLVGRHELNSETQTIGRAWAGIDLDENDKTISQRHAAVRFVDGIAQIADLSSTNGTELKVEGAATLEIGAEFRVGQQLLRLEAYGATTLTESISVGAPEPEVEKAVAVSPPESCTVEFLNLGKSVTVEPEYSVLEAAEEHDIELRAVCRAGTCGADPIRVMSGAENLSAADEDELKWLKHFGHDNRCRFACVARLRGDVKIETVEPQR